ncbi:MAG: hypothetical protein C4519_02405 [Desulfobacteraceae bacterium]|nr:MAG: hypothetical protein C4519_02405 [Desulfobacteraceae bacterium]
MKQYVIDELRPADHAKLKAHLDERYAVSGFEGLYWIPINAALLDGVQKTHEDCRPFYFALELSPGKMDCELLVRSRQQIHCQCIQYATERQRNWLIDWIDALLGDLGISI